MKNSLGTGNLASRIDLSALRLVILVLPVLPWQARSQDVISDREISVPVFEASIRLDGFLDETEWQKAAVASNFTELDPREGAKPEVETKVLLGYDEKNLYIGFVCHENDITKVRATTTKRDTYTKDDWVQILLDTYSSSKEGYVLMVNPSGSQIDMYARKKGKDMDMTFDLEWQAASIILDEKWTVEIRIPFKSLRFPSASSQCWGVDFGRIRPRESEEYYTWIPHSRNEPSRFPRFGRLFIDNKLSGSGFIFLPYLTIGTSDPQSFTYKYGCSGKYYLSSSSVFDWAIRPDYAQIESDAPQIDVNTTSALYYPEKRPLFLERKDLFETPVEVVHTRMINDPIIALKFTGRVGKFDIGYIGGIDQHTPWVIPFSETSVSVNSGKTSLSKILRLRCDLSAESQIGLLTTGRELGNSFNRTLGVDIETRFLSNYYFAFQGIQSWTKEPDDTLLFSTYPSLTFGKYTSRFDGEEFSGKAYVFELSRTGRHLDFSLVQKELSPLFRADNGYVAANDLKHTSARVELKLRPNRFLIEQLTPEFNISNTEKCDGDRKETCITQSLSFMLRGMNSFSLDYSLRAKSYQDYWFDGIWSIQGTCFTYTLGLLSVGIVGVYGREINYFAVSPELGYTANAYVLFEIKPLSWLRLKLNCGRYAFWDETRRSKIYDISTFQNEIHCTFSSQFSSRLVVQHRSGDEVVDVSPLLSLELTPFSVFYLGSNHSFEKTKSFPLIRASDYHVFLKFQYSFEI